MEEAIQSGAADLVGLARPLCLEPELPNEMLEGKKEESLQYSLVSSGLLRRFKTSPLE